jgi:single-strand DNA-binding protein
MNRATILGYLGADPEIRPLNEGGRVASFSVATTETWTDEDSSEKRSHTEWHRVAIYAEPLIALTEKTLHKGSKVLLEGSLQTRKYQKDGVDHFSTEIVLRPYTGNLTLLDAPAHQSPAPLPRATDPPRVAAPAGPTRCEIEAGKLHLLVFTSRDAISAYPDARGHPDKDRAGGPSDRICDRPTRDKSRSVSSERGYARKVERNKPTGGYFAALTAAHRFF